MQIQGILEKNASPITFPKDSIKLEETTHSNDSITLHISRVESTNLILESRPNSVCKECRLLSF